MNINHNTTTGTVLFQDTVQCHITSVLINHLHAYSPSGQQYSLIIHFRDTRNWAYTRVEIILKSKQCNIKEVYDLWYDLKTGFLLLCLCCSVVIICVVRLLFVLFYVLFVCKCVLPPGDNPIAVNKYIISYTISTKIWYLSHMMLSDT
jgi:hypothetical protein